MKVTVTKTEDHAGELAQRLLRLLKHEVLVGVSEKTSVENVLPGEINNAVKAYLNDNGDPVSGIPQREFMRPAIQKALPKTTKYLVTAARGELENDKRKVGTSLERVGLVARDAVVEEITNGPLNAAGRSLAPKTLELRKRGRGPNRGPVAGTEPLIEQGALRQSITYVIDGAEA